MTLRAGTWTVLFTDMVGSTEQRVRLGDAAADQLVREHDAIVARALAAHGGELVGGTGDGVMCAFAGAADALAAAVAIQQRLERRNRNAPEQLRLRVGLSLGDLAFEDGALHGLAAHEAARVCASAEAGEILVSDVVRTVAGSRAGCELVPRGQLEFKGLPTPVRVWRVAWEPATEPEQPPIPALLESSPTLAFSGREGELATVLRAWKEGSGGSRRCVVVAGEPGIGKTRLVAEAARVTHGEGAVVLYGRCDDELGVPFQPFAEALDGYLEGARDVVWGRWPGDLTRLTPKLSDQVRNLPAPLEADPESEQYRLFDAVDSWLTALSAEQPVVMVLDDLHWATEPTLLMLRHVVRTTGSARLLLVVTYRETDIGAEHPLAATLASLYREPGVKRMMLGGLNADALGVLLESAGYELDTAGVELRDTLAAETDGNPFFVTEVLRHLIETGAIRRGEDGRWVATTGHPLILPTSAREVITHRVRRLGDDVRRILTIAAVIGREFDLELLAVVSGSTEEVVLEAVEDALRAGLIQENAATVDRFGFAHAIVRNVIYQELPASRRVRIHCRIGEALEHLLGGRPGNRLMELAHHFIEGAPAGRADSAAEYAAAAARQAEANLAFEDALDLCHRGLAALTASDPDSEGVPRPEVFDLLFRLGRAQVLSGRAGGRETLLRAFEVADALDDPDRMASAVLSLNRGFFSRMGRTDVQFVEAIERAIAARPGEDAVTAELLATLASELVWAADGDRRFPLADQALAMARQIDDPRTLARVLLLRTLTISAPDTLTKRTVESHELMNIAEELEDPAIRFQAAFSGARTASETGDIDDANRFLKLAAEVAAELRQPRVLWLTEVMRTASQIGQGRLKEAEELAQQALQLGQRTQDGGAEAQVFFSEQLLEIRRWQDRLGEVLDLFGGVAGVDGIDFGYSLARYLYDAGEEDAATSCYEAIVQRVPLPPRRDMLAVVAMANLAYLAARIGDGERARTIYEVLVPFGHAFATTTIMKPVGRHHLGMLAATLGQVDAAEDHFAAALAIHEKAHAPLLAAETQLEWARLLIGRQPEADRAARLIEQVQAAAAAHQAPFLERSCELVARST